MNTQTFHAHGKLLYHGGRKRKARIRYEGATSPKWRALWALAIRWHDTQESIWLDRFSNVWRAYFAEERAK